MDFYVARANERKRQDFLNSIRLGKLENYVKEIKYINKETDYCMDVDCHFATRNFFVPNLKSTINVYPLAFDNNFTENKTDFLSVLIDHECFHAREYYQKPKITIPSKKLTKVETAIFHLDLELRAYHNQIRMIKTGRDVSETFLDNLESRLRKKERLKSFLGQEGVEILTA